MNKIYSLQAMRGAAALAVVLLHAMESSLIFAGSVDQSIVNYFNYGLLGVDFFFVLSGFIIFSSHVNDLDDISSLKKYVVKRLVRIYPPYLPVSIAYILIIIFVPSISENGNDYGLVSSLLLIPTSKEPALGPAWTLVYEMMFYFIFIIWFIDRPKFKYFMLSWFVAILVFNAYVEIDYDNKSHEFINDSISIIKHFLSKLNIEFMVGILCAYFCGYKYLNYKYLSIFIGLCLIVYFGITISSDHASIKHNSVFFGIAFAFLIYGIVALEINNLIKVSKGMVLLGDASYAIYLIHYPVVSIVSRVVGRFFNVHSVAINISICVVFSVLIGIAYHKIFEKPVIRLITTRLRLFLPSYFKTV